MKFIHTGDWQVGMKAALVGFQCAGLLIAIAIMWIYPITRRRAEETQRRLREMAS